MNKGKPFCGIAVFAAAIAALVVACSSPSGGTPVPVISITTQPSGAELTEGAISGNLSVTATVTEDAILSFQWYSNSTASNVDGTAVAGATEASYTIPTNLAVGDHYYFCEITAPGAVSLRSNAVTVRILSAGTPSIDITTQPASPAPFTVGAITGSLSVAASGINGATVTGYQWYGNHTASNAGGAKITGATAASYTIPTNLPVGVYYYFCEITAAGGADSKRSNIATVTVLVAGTPYISITTQPVGYTEVMEDAITGSLTVAASGINGATVTGYQWYSNTTASTVGGTTVSGATAASFDIPANLIPGTHFYFCEITASGGAATVRSDIAKVTVSEVSAVPVITITVQPSADTAIRKGETETLSVTASVTEDAAITGYQWYKAESNSNESGVKVSGATAASFDIPTDLALGDHFYFCEVTASDGAATVRSAIAKVTVSAVPVINITSHPATETTVTEGETETLSVTATVTDGEVITGYQWYKPSGNSNEGGAKVTGATAASFNIPATLTPGDHFYFCEITATGGAVPMRSNVAKITVSAIPVIGFVIQVAELDDPNLVGQSAGAAPVTNTPFTAAGNWAAYQWYVDGTAQTGNGGSTATFTFNRLAGVYNLTVVVTDGEDIKYSGSCRVTVR